MGVARAYVRAMPDLDLGPNDYRKQDPETGAWLRNVDKKDARRWGIICIAFIVFFLSYCGLNGAADSVSIGAAMAGIGFAAGGLITLSLKRGS